MARLTFGTFGLLLSAFLIGCSPEATTKAEHSQPGQPASVAAEDELSAKAAVQKALEVGKDDPGKAISILEKALKTSPKDREALLLLGVISVIDGEKAEAKEKRITRFHQAFAALDQIQKSQKELNQAEKGFQPRIELGEARALALEGKTGESFAILKKLMASGNDDFDSIDMVEDLRPLQNLPDFHAFVKSTYEPKLALARKEVAAQLAKFKPFSFHFKLKDLDGKEVSLADYRGKPTIVDLWGTWCPPCRKEIPHFVALAQKYKDQGLEVVGINCNESGSDDDIKKTVREFVAAYKIEYKCLLDDETTQEKVPDFQGYPTTLFIDGKGKVRLVFSQSEPKAKLEAAILTLLEEDKKTP
jgi:thiol-disulfide isomerase/thioredoxin